jgi:hypothetical protein
MALAESDLVRIGDYVKGNLREWIRETGAGTVPADPVTNTNLLDRVVRVESELSAQREIMVVRFEAVDKRFEDLIHHMDKRFGLLTWLVTASIALGGVIATFVII